MSSDVHCVARVNIINPEEVLNDAAILSENWCLRELPFNDENAVITWLARRRLLKNQYTCPICNILCTVTKNKDNCDGYRWQCKRCRKVVTIRTGSFFIRSRLDLETLIVIMYCWSRNLPQKDIAREARLSETSHTVADWCFFFRDVCKEHLISNPLDIGGFNEDGTSKVVEVGESNFFQNRLRQGVGKKDLWVFGGIERGSRACFLVAVGDRSQDTLSKSIRKFILPGTTIVSSSSMDLEKIGGELYDYQHPDNRNISTQNIKNVWLRLKAKIRRQYGTSSEKLFKSYLHEFIWRNSLRNEKIFENFIVCLAQQYPV